MNCEIDVSRKLFDSPLSKWRVDWSSSFLLYNCIFLGASKVVDASMRQLPVLVATSVSSHHNLSWFWPCWAVFGGEKVLKQQNYQSHTGQWHHIPSLSWSLIWTLFPYSLPLVLLKVVWFGLSIPTLWSSLIKFCPGAPNQPFNDSVASVQTQTNYTIRRPSSKKNLISWKTHQQPRHKLAPLQRASRQVATMRLGICSMDCVLAFISQVGDVGSSARTSSPEDQREELATVLGLNQFFAKRVKSMSVYIYIIYI